LADKRQPDARAVADPDHKSSLPRGWVRTRLGEIVEPSKERVDPEQIERVRYIGLEHIEKDTGKLLGYGYSDEVRSAKSEFQSGDLLYGKLRPYLNKVHVADFPGICSTDILVFPENPYVPNRYLLYRLLSRDFVRYANIRMSGVQHPRVHYEDLAQFPLALPPAAEQQRIVDAIETQFARLDTAILALERAQANLERYRGSVLQAACEGRLVPTEAELARREGRDYEPADQLLEHILEERRAKWEEERWEYEIERAKKKAAQAERKAAGLPYYIRELEPEHWEHRTPEEYQPYLPEGDKWKQKYDEPEPPDAEDLPGLLEGWCWASLDQVIEFSQNGFGKRRSEKGEPTTVLRLADIEDGQRVTLEDVRRIRMDDEEIDKYRLLKNDLLCIRVNGSPDLVGRFIPFGGADEPIAFCDHFIRFRFAVPEVASFFVRYSDTRRARRYVDLNKVSSAGQNTISQTTMESLVFPLPPLAEQRRIVDEVERQLSVVQALERSVEADLARAERLRQAILNKAFEGRLVSHDPGDEPAAELLTRIKRHQKDARKTRSYKGNRKQEPPDSDQYSVNIEEPEDLAALLRILQGGGRVTPDVLLDASGLEVGEYYVLLDRAIRANLISERREGYAVYLELSDEG
jgi:type I restriction enzyme S subunit